MVLPPKPKPRSGFQSHDDLSAVSAQDAAEARLRAAMRLADEEAKRADEEEKKNKELMSALDTLKAQPQPIQVTASIIPPDGKPVSLSPQALTFRGKHWKFTIPFTLIIALVPLIWALISDYMQMKRDFKTQTDTFGRITARVEEVNTFAHEVSKSNEDLREKVAELSGYLAGVLPKAGVKVPGTETGGTYVNIVSDPLPAGDMKKRQKPIVVHTPVPAPSPRQQ